MSNFKLTFSGVCVKLGVGNGEDNRLIKSNLKLATQIAGISWIV